MLLHGHAVNAHREARANCRSTASGCGGKAYTVVNYNRTPRMGGRRRIQGSCCACKRAISIIRSPLLVFDLYVLALKPGFPPQTSQGIKESVSAGKPLSSSISIISWPTAPVAPTIAMLYLSFFTMKQHSFSCSFVC